MTTTTSVVHRASASESYRRHGYFFREAAMLTILMGVAMHAYRVIFGDDLTLQYVVTTTTDVLLLVPMTYASVTGILGYRRMVFTGTPHRIALTAALVYITASVPLHLYVALVLRDVGFYVHLAGNWFSYLLLIVVYPVFLTMLWKLKFKESWRDHAN